MGVSIQKRLALRLSAAAQRYKKNKKTELRGPTCSILHNNTRLIASKIFPLWIWNRKAR